MNKAAIFAVHTQEECPQCGAPLVFRSGKRGPFAGCSAFPECDFIRPLHGQSEGKIIKVLEGIPCPKCGLDKALRQGRYGMFVGCTGFPHCHHSETIDQPDSTGVDCPQCQAGTLIQRRSRFGKAFFSCSEFPRCQFSLNHSPVAQSCPHCQFPLLIEKKTAQGQRLFCANRSCGQSVTAKPPE